MNMLLLVASAALCSVGYAVMPCPSCAQFCGCVNRAAPRNLLPTARLDQAYEKCDTYDYPEEFDSAADDAKWSQYEQCVTPPCPACKNTISIIYGTDGSSRKKRDARRKRQADEDAEWDKFEKCVARELGMTQQAYVQYEEELFSAMDGVETCYVSSCGQTYEQMESNDQACMTQAGLTDADFEFEDK